MFVSAFIAVQFLAISVTAQTSTWNVDSSGNWFDNANWDLGTIAKGAGNTANFTHDITFPRTISFDNPFAIGHMNFSDGGSGGSQYSINGGSNALTLEVGAGIPTVNTITDANINAALAGIHGLRKTGTGKLSLNGNNTFTGGVILDEGTLAASVGTLGAASNTVVMNGGTLQLLQASVSQNITHNGGEIQSFGGEISGSISSNQLTVSGTGLGLTLSGNNNVTSMIVNSGAVVKATSIASLPTGGLVLHGGGVELLGTASETYNQTVMLGLDVLVGTSTTGGAILVQEASNNFTLAGTLMGKVLGKGGSGKLTLTNNLNQFDGAISIGQGTLSVSSNGNLGTGSQEILLNGGTLEITGTGMTGLGTRTLTLGNSHDSAISVDNPTNTFVIDQTDLDNSFGSLTKNGAGTLDLVSKTMFSGQLKVNAGTLDLSNNIFNNGHRRNQINGGVLQVSKDLQLGLARDSSQAFATKFDGGTLRIIGSDFSTNFNRVFQLDAGGGTIDVDDPTHTVSILTEVTGMGGLTKSGAGTLELDVAHSYTGSTVVDDGTLILKNGTPANGGAMRANGGTLQLTGNSAYSMGANSLRAQSGGTIDYDGVTVNGGFMRGAGNHNLVAGTTNTFNGTTILSDVSLGQGTTTNFVNVSNGGEISNNALLSWDGGMNTSSARIHVNSILQTEAWFNDGVINVNNGGTLNHAGSNLVSGGGSRISIDSAGIINMSGGTELDLNGGLLVNNGTLNGTLNINFGSVVKGTGVFGGVNVNDGGEFSPGASPGTVTTGDTSWGNGGSYVVELVDADGIAGTDWDLWEINGLLNIDSGFTSNSQFTLALESLTTGNASGLATNFDPTQSYSWTVLTTSNGIVGFDLDRINLQSSGFVNDLAGGSFAIHQFGGNLNVVFSAVPEPSSLSLIALCASIGMARRRRKI